MNDSTLREAPPQVRTQNQRRLLLEELCCDLCRFEHVRNGAPPGAIEIDREVYMGSPGAFADIRVRAPGAAPYFVEVKHGYPDEVLARHLARKYGRDAGAVLEGADRLVLVVDAAGRGDWVRRFQEMSGGIAPGLAVEIWDEAELLRRLRECFGVEVGSIGTEDLIDVRHAIDRAKGYHAFGAPTREEYEHDPLKEELLWHFGFWRLKELREKRQLAPRQMLVPGIYRNVVVLLADMCSFSSFMRDTPDAEVTRQSLTTFYSMARDQIINRGGMLYQFVGDEVIGMFGIPEAEEDAPSRALAVARSLLSVGASVSHHWQRHIDRVQPSGGLHIGMAQGDVQIVSLRPYSRTHVGALGDCINVAARLMGSAGPGEIVATNSLYRRLDAGDRAAFTEIEPAEAKNVGRISAWRSRAPDLGSRG